MAKVHAVVDRAGYVFKGHPIPKGRMVVMDKATFENTQRTQPPYFREAKDSEVKKANFILDLSTVETVEGENIAKAKASSSKSE